MNIDETQLHNWRTELSGQRFEGAFLTRSQTFSVTALVSLVSAAGEKIPNMLPFEIEEVPGTGAQQKEADLEEQAARDEEQATAGDQGVLEGEEKTKEEKAEEKAAISKSATKESSSKPQTSAQRAQTATADKEKSSSSSKSKK